MRPPYAEKMLKDRRCSQGGAIWREIMTTQADGKALADNQAQTANMAEGAYYSQRELRLWQNFSWRLVLVSLEMGIGVVLLCVPQGQQTR